MKSLFALLVLVCGLANAAEIKVYEVPTDPWSKEIKGSFAVNPSMNRAWVEVEMFSRHSRRDENRSFARAKVEGLTYDSETKKIMLQHEGQLIECGYQTGRYVFKRIVNTNCSFVQKRVKKTIDTGYETYKQEYIQLYLVTK